MIHRVLSNALATLAAVLLPLDSTRAGNPNSAAVDFRYSPPEWQTAVCLADDPQKTLVDRGGELLYHYGLGNREFGTRVGVTVSPEAKWHKQELVSPRIPIVRTLRTAADLQIVEEAFAHTGLPDSPEAPDLLRRLDAGGVNRNWANPPETVDPALSHIAVHMGGSIEYELTVPAGAARRLALVLCEGWWNETGKRVQILRVEGADPRTADLIADLGRNQAGAFWFDARDTDRNGRIEVRVEAAPAAADRNTILNGLWAFPPDVPSDTEALLAGRLNPVALARLEVASPGGPPRNDLILVHVTNTGSESKTLRPRLVVDTTLAFSFQPGTRRAQVNNHETITSSLPMSGLLQETPSRRLIQLDALPVPAGKTATFFVQYSGGGSIVIAPTALRQALAARKRAAAYWEKSPLPFGRVQVPDAGIQALVDASLRNIWQAREIKQGLPVFQVGPTCYRGLWIVDGAFLLEAATMLGAGEEARSGITYTLRQQKPSGAFEVLSPHYYKENGILLWTCARHARLTQDKAWLESVWPQLERAAEYIRVLRQRSRENANPLDDGLNPPGEIDGGLSGQATGFQRPEFSNVHWNLLGLRAFIEGARWLGKEATAAKWQQEYDDLYATFRAAATRDAIRDLHGNTYVPIFMANAGNELPQRAQWTFCHAVYPGQIFPANDPLVGSTLAMLEATEREGMVYGTGWDATGLWNYFASFYGHAWLWQGNRTKSVQGLYAYANHASPTLVWREEQSLQGAPFKKVGDMPHNWASAEFIRLVIHLLALDRGDELHLLEGFPEAWAGPGNITRLRGVATPFGRLEMTVRADRSGRALRVEVKPLAGDCRRVVVHWPDGGTVSLNPHRGGSARWHRRSGNAE